MFRVPPSAAQLAAIGLTPDDYAADENTIGVWPDNWQAYLLFSTVRTQWRVGPGGVCGLDYGPLDRRIDRLELSPEDREDLEACLQVMELAAMVEINKRD